MIGLVYGERMTVEWSRYSDDELRRVAAETDAYLAKNALKEVLSESSMLMTNMIQLVPVTSENLLSGHLHPLFEAESDLLASTTQGRLGLYKQAIASLRGVLELGLLSIYWDVNDTAHLDIQEWLHGKKDTPGFRAIGKKLGTIPAVEAALLEIPDTLPQAQALAHEISGYVHSRGRRNSTAALIPQSNRPVFSESALKKWLSLRERVLKVVLTFTLLKYPLGLQITPLSAKFGLGGPAGGFVEPFVRERFLAHLGSEKSALLQRISNADKNAQATAAQIRSLPDLTPEQWREDMLRDDRSWVQMMGYEGWRRTYDVRPVGDDETDADQRKREAYAESLRSWAQESGLMTQDGALVWRQTRSSADQ